MVALVRSRLTDDLDIAVVVPSGEHHAFLTLARDRGFSWQRADEAMFIEGGLLRAKTPEGITIDWMIADDLLLTQVVARAQPVEVGGARVMTSTVEDLLLMKLDANRPLDFDDAIAIKDAYGNRLDRGYLREIGARLGLLRQLENLLGPL
jgi:hypothetical protein